VSWFQSVNILVFVIKGRLSASGVGSLVGLQSEQIQNIAAHYADRVCMLLLSSVTYKHWVYWMPHC